MKVVLDVSLLLDALHSDRGYTGLHRATHDLYVEIVRSKATDVFFTASESSIADVLLRRSSHELDFVDSNHLLPSFEYPGALGRVLPNLLASRLVPTSNGWWKRTLARQARSVVKRLGEPVRATDTMAEVFHSPYAPLPPIVRTPAQARVITVHDVIPLKHPEFCRESGVRTMERIVRSIDPSRDVAIVPSRHTRDDLLDLVPLPAERVRVVPWAADPHLFHAQTPPATQESVRERHGIPPGPYFLSVSTLEPRKNFAHLIRAFCRLQEEHPAEPASLVLVGSRGWLEDEIFRTAEAAPFRQRIVITGRVPDDELAALYSAATAFVYVSLYEGFGLPVLEAMQCGAPVVASKTTSVPEVCGTAGLLVDPTSQDEIVQALRLVQSEPERARAMREASLERATRFSWQRAAEETIDAFALAARLAARRSSALRSAGVTAPLLGSTSAKLES